MLTGNTWLNKTMPSRVQQLRGPNFDPRTPSSGHFTYYLLLSTLCHRVLCHMTPRGLPTDPHPPLLVHVVIECPLKILATICYIKPK